MAKQVIPGSDAITVQTDGSVVVKETKNTNTGKLGTFMGLTKITVSTTAPTNPDVGDIWLDTS